MTSERATFGAGCFWGIEELFRRQEGVLATAVGYMGGAFPNPSYEDVCTDRTGHAEVVEVDFDPEKISYERLLDLFWENHDPTTLNRQGPDIGSQYRSVIFFHTPEQEQSAKLTRDKLTHSTKLKNPIVTEIVPAGTFWRAEEYHQQYIAKGGICHF